jgi:hypothetical protein
LNVRERLGQSFAVVVLAVAVSLVMMAFLIAIMAYGERF